MLFKKKKKHFNTYFCLFIWLHSVLVVARGIFSCSLWEQTWALCFGSVES